MFAAVAAGNTCAAEAFGCYWDGDTCYKVNDGETVSYQCLGLGAFSAIPAGDAVEWNQDAVDAEAAA